MTQVITTITQDYVLLVADRRLTFGSGPRQGQIADDDTCKLVSLCNNSGIGYTGLAHIEKIPTHEWIAKTLASEQCSDPATASRLLADRAGGALASELPHLRNQTFIIGGWAYFENLTGLRSYVCAITNVMDSAGQTLSKPSDAFTVFTKALHDGEDLAVHVAGQPLELERGRGLKRNLQRLVSREISAKAAVRLIVDEVIHSSQQFSIVGNKVLGLCIPRRAVQASIDSGRSVLLAAQPNEDDASFFYYDPTYNELQQLGPTITCGGFATTDVKTENDESQSGQSSQLRILAVPKASNQPARRSAPHFKRPQTPRPIVGFELGISVDNAVEPGAMYAIPAAIRNTGDVPLVFSKTLSDNVGQEVSPSVQGGAVPAITFGLPTGDWSIAQFEPVSRTRFAGLVVAPGGVFEFNFGSFTAPVAPIGSISRSRLVDLSVRFTDTILGQLLNASGSEFHFPTNVNPELKFRIAAKSAPSALVFHPARVIDTASGELISGPVDGSPPPNFSAGIVDTSICGGKPGVGIGSFPTGTDGNKD